MTAYESDPSIQADSLALQAQSLAEIGDKKGAIAKFREAKVIYIDCEKDDKVKEMDRRIKALGG